MKKTYILLAAAAILAAAVSCNKDQDSTPKGVKVNITVADLNPDTKAVKSGWTSGDKINIWFDRAESLTPHLIITYDGSKWVPGTINPTAEAALKTDDTGTFRYLHIRFIIIGNIVTFNGHTGSYSGSLTACKGTHIKLGGFRNHKIIIRQSFLILVTVCRIEAVCKKTFKILIVGRILNAFDRECDMCFTLKAERTFTILAQLKNIILSFSECNAQFFT